jgi:hypothetical protein
MEATTQGINWKNVKSQGFDSDPGFKTKLQEGQIFFCGGGTEWNLF